MRQSTRLVANTLATFVRMALTLGIGLLTTRLQLQLLGVIDFGLLGALGATHFISAMYAVALLTSIQRNFAYEIGLAQQGDLPRVFNATLLLTAVSIIAILVLGTLLAAPILHNLQIPSARWHAAIWCYFSTLGGTAITALMAPWQGVIAAHQELPMSSIIEVASAILRLLAISALFLLPGDRLVAFVMTNFAAQILVAAILIALVTIRYPAARINLSSARRSDILKIAQFTGWTTVGNLAWSMRQNASAILVNLRFGPSGNAAFAVASQVATYGANLATAITRAIQPAIVSMQASGNRRVVQQLTNITSKYVLVLLSLPLVPALLETPALLRHWLGTPPPESVLIVRLTIVWSLMVSLRLGHDLAAQAQGDLRRYTLIHLLFSVLALAAASIGVFYLHASLWLIPTCTIALEWVLLSVSIRIVSNQAGLSTRAWIVESAFPSLLIVAASSGATLAIKNGFGLTQPLNTMIIYGLICCIAFWSFALTAHEKAHFWRIWCQAVSDRITSRR